MLRKLIIIVLALVFCLNSPLNAANIMFLNTVAIFVPPPVIPSDITVPGNIVQGVPGDGDWPGNEAPPLAIDDSIDTKYLHFKGDFDPNPGTGGTGFQVTPSGPSIVTGLSFTTANDVPGRDPIAFELYGSNVSIDGPYELIASGDILDFSQEAEWPRFTKNETEISFDNDIAYNHYQLIFTAIRGPIGGSVDSMQIAEVELLGLFLSAGQPSPADRAVDVDPRLTTVQWTRGITTVQHDVYLNTDPNTVVTGDASAFQGTVEDTSFVITGGLDLGTRYYWRIDEITVEGVVIPGSVWSFTTAGYVTVTDSEMVLHYDTTVEPPITDLSITVDPPVDLDAYGLTTLQITFKGQPARFMEGDDGTITLSGAGADIWGMSDEFRYAHRQLSGDGSITARVVSNGQGSNTLAKGGIMIRRSLDGGSTHAMTVLTGGNGGGGAFQWRPVADGESQSVHDPTPAAGPPYWVRLERLGSQLSGYLSADGVTWSLQGDPQTISMGDSVHIGLCVTSHQTDELRSFVFDNVSTTGAVSSGWQVADIGVEQGGNDPAPLSLILTDAAGNTAIATHPNLAATLIPSWTTWSVPICEFKKPGDFTPGRPGIPEFGASVYWPGEDYPGSGDIYVGSIYLTPDCYSYNPSLWQFSYDSLDGNWSHDNESDKYDESRPGEGYPGGVAVFTRQVFNFDTGQAETIPYLHIQDARESEIPWPIPDNSKIYFTHPICWGLDDTWLIFRARLATPNASHPLDNQPGGQPWPAGGIGLGISDDGKGMFGIAEAGVGIISFSLAKAGEIIGLDSDALVMNGLADSSGNVGTGPAGATNWIAVDDVTKWNRFEVRISKSAEGPGTHEVIVLVQDEFDNLVREEAFSLSAGSAFEVDDNHIAIGSPVVEWMTAFDMDWIMACHFRAPLILPIIE